MILKDSTGTPNQNIAIDFTPTMDINSSFVIANPASRMLNAMLSWRFSGTISPKGSTLFFAELLIPVGLILSAPWVFQGYSARKDRNKIRTNNPAEAP